MDEINKEKKVVAILIILIVVVSASGFVYFQIRYSTLNEKYNELQDDYDDLNLDYFNQNTQYTRLQDQYEDLNDEYTILYDTFQQYNRLSIDSLMMLTYNEIRSQVQPNYNPWLGSYYYTTKTVEYGADVCAHDLARLYWPNIEDDYYNIRGTQLSHDAYYIIEDTIELIGITSYDTTTEKIEKILDFIYDYIEYSDDINNEFLFPVEVLTYRSGDCDDFSILASTLFEYVGIESAIGFFESTSQDYDHCMVLVNLPDLDYYGYWYYDDLTDLGLSDGRWIIIEPQVTIDMQEEDDLLSEWSMIAVSEVPN